MRSEDIKLGLVLVVALILAGILSNNLGRQHADIAKTQTLEHANKWPLAGFQKFLADVVWMRFLNFAGSHALNDANINRYEWYLQKIVALDPDFYEVYRDGALFFGPIDIDRALWFVDAGMSNPRYKKTKSQLPLIGGQIIMRRESMKYYKGKEMDLKRLSQAQKYFDQAKSIPGHLPTAVTNFVRTTVFLSDSDEPHDILALREWAKVLRRARAESEGEDSGTYGISLTSGKLEQRVIRQISKVAERYIKKKDADDLVRETAKKVVNTVIAQSFPNVHFDAQSFKPYPKTAELTYRGTIEDPEVKKYVIELDAADYFAVQSIIVRARRGSAELALLINGKPVVGLDKIHVDGKKTRLPKLQPLQLNKKQKKHMSSYVPDVNKIRIPDPLYGNQGRKGCTIELQIKSVNGLKDLSYIVRAYKGNFF